MEEGKYRIFHTSVNKNITKPELEKEKMTPFQIEDNMIQVEDMMKDDRKVIIIKNTSYQISRKRIELHDEIFGFFQNDNQVFQLVTAHSVIGRTIKRAIWNELPSPFVAHIS